MGRPATAENGEEDGEEGKGADAGKASSLLRSESSPCTCNPCPGTLRAPLCVCVCVCACVRVLGGVLGMGLGLAARGSWS
jgi:hypothetical protein